jgi:hypothetical protein
MSINTAACTCILCPFCILFELDEDRNVGGTLKLYGVEMVSIDGKEICFIEEDLLAVHIRGTSRLGSRLCENV